MIHGRGVIQSKHSTDVESPPPHPPPPPPPHVCMSIQHEGVMLCSQVECLYSMTLLHDRLAFVYHDRFLFYALVGNCCGAFMVRTDG